MMTDFTEQEVVEILNQYSSLVDRIAKNTFKSSPAIDYADLCQVGELAVLRAVKTYDPSCGANIKSYVYNVVRRDIYNEAARFLGVFTVDHKVTEIAAKANRLFEKGKSDAEIAEILSNQIKSRNFDESHIRDMRMAYTRRAAYIISDDEGDSAEEESIEDLLSSIPSNNVEKFILNERIMGLLSADAASEALGVSLNKIYKIERILKQRIERAISGRTDEL
jgi:RNA polymerase sigma factor (sigma-70 family)